MIDTLAGPYRSTELTFHDLVLALSYNVLAPMQRGELSFQDTPLPSGTRQAMENQDFALVLADEFLAATDDIANAQPDNTMIRQILAVIRDKPSDFDALIEIIGRAMRATTRVRYCKAAYEHIVRAFALLDGLIEQYDIAFRVFPTSDPAR